MKHLPLVLVWLIALAVGEVAPWPLPPPNPSVQEREGTVETKQRVEEPPRQLVSGGTPTGGGTYPFLAIVNYDDAADEPFEKPLCHGVMVSNDVVLLLGSCNIDVSRPVLVGDYSEANPDSVQLRNFVVGEGGGPVALSSPNETLRLARIEPVTTAGFVAARLPADPFSPIPDQYLSVVGYGSNSSWETIYRDYYYFDHERTYPGKATEATVQVIDFHHCVEVLYNPLLNETTTFCALAPGASESSGAGPCAGDHGAPVLDGTGSLVGLARNTYCDNWVNPSTFERLSYHASWIKTATCQLSNDALHFCSNLVCPPEATILGYPSAVIPDATLRVKTFNGFRPASLSQNPPVGALVNSTTDMTVTAMDSFGGNASCTWTLRIPPITYLGFASILVNKGSSDPQSAFIGRGVRSGLVVKATGELLRKLVGTEKMVARLRKGNRTYSGALTLSKGKIKGTVQFPKPFQIQFTNRRGGSDVKAMLSVRNALKDNMINIDLYGQVKDDQVDVVEFR